MSDTVVKGKASWEIKGNQSIHFLVVIMASGIARGRVRTTTTTESRKMAGIPKPKRG